MIRKGYIYVIVNGINGKYYYGKTFNIQKRWKQHIKNASFKINRRLYDAMNHYGYSNFSIHQIKEINVSSEFITQNLNILEIYFIKLSSSLNPKYGYNMTNGGDGGDTFSNSLNKKEIIEKRRKRNIGKKRTPEQCKNIQKGVIEAMNKIDPIKRKERSQRAIKNRMKRIKENGYTEKELKAQQQNKKSLIAYNKSKEGRKRVSDQFKGKKKKPFSKEHRKNIGKASKGRKIPGKKIMIEGIIYESFHDAHRKLSLPLMTIRNRVINKNFTEYLYVL